MEMAWVDFSQSWCQWPAIDLNTLDKASVSLVPMIHKERLITDRRPFALLILVDKIVN